MNEQDQARTKYPRVSDIIGIQTEREMRSIPLENLIAASEKGTKIHRYCTAYAKGLMLPEIEIECAPYLEAFKEWSNLCLKKVLLTRTRLYDDQLRYSGEPDMIVELKNGKKALIDIKSSAQESKAWAVQLAAYDNICRKSGWTYDEIFILHLKKKAPKKKKGEDQEDLPQEVKSECLMQLHISTHWDIFASALKCYDYFNRKEPKEKKSDE